MSNEGTRIKTGYGLGDISGQEGTLIEATSPGWYKVQLDSMEWPISLYHKEFRPI